MNLKSIAKKILNYMRGKRIVYREKVCRPYELIVQEKNRFKGQVTIVTGASGVIGRAIAYRLAAEGALVYACGTKIEKVNAVVSEINNDGFTAKSLAFSLLDEQAIVNAVKSVVDENGKLDLLVCCAGGGARNEMRPLVEQSTEVIDSILNVNLRGAILCCREVLKYMTKLHSGNIILISSAVGVRGLANYSEYAAAKAGIIAFMQSIAMEYGRNRIRINCVSPGIVERGFIDDLKLERVKKTNWLNDFGKPEDIAGMVAYLNTQDASFITGQNIVVDGGRSLGLKGA